MKKRSMDRTGKLIKLFMDRYLGSILLWQCDGSIELIIIHPLCLGVQLPSVALFFD